MYGDSHGTNHPERHPQQEECLRNKWELMEFDVKVKGQENSIED